MNNTLTIESARHIPIGELSELEISKLVSLQKDSIANLDQAKRLKDWLDSAISLKYQNKSTETRQLHDKATGTIHFNDGNFKITSVVTKRVDWDQAKLKEAVSEIKEFGDNPYEYVTIAYKLSETKFNAWPEYIKKFFRPARILKTSKETFKIEEIKEVGHE
jgi:hypothetical protein